MRAVWWLGLVLVVAARLSAIHYEQSRASVLQELGKPTSSIMRGGREVLLYPHGVRIELEQGRVVFLQGLEPTEPLEPVAGAAPEADPAGAPQPAAPKEASKDVPAEEEAGMAEGEEGKLTPEQAKALEEAEKEFAAARAKAQAELEKATEDLTKMYERPEQAEPEDGPVRAVTLILGVLVQGFAGWVLMVVAIKLTAKYWAVDIEWPGILIAAAVDAAVKIGVRLIGFFAFGLEVFFYSDEALGAIALLFILRKVSTNRRLDQAVTVMFTSKIFCLAIGHVLYGVLLAAIF